MTFEVFGYAVAVFGVIAGLAGLLAAEYFHGMHYLLYPGGGLALLAVGALTFLISRNDPPEDAGH